MRLKNRMREIRSYGSVGESADDRRLYPEAGSPQPTPEFWMSYDMT